MRSRHPLPRLWMMTDERQGEALWTALDRLPRGAGIVFRHYSLPLQERRALLVKISRIAKRKDLVLVAAAPKGLSVRHRDGVHNHAGQLHNITGFRTASAHNAAELQAAARKRVDLVFLSPVFRTRSHADADAKALGPLRFARLARMASMPVIALGGMEAKKAKRLKGPNVHGWGAIDAWSKPHFKAIRWGRP